MFVKQTETTEKWLSSHIESADKCLIKNAYLAFQVDRSASVFGGFLSTDLVTNPTEIELDDFAECQVGRGAFKIKTALPVGSNSSLNFFQVFGIYWERSAGAHSMRSLINSAIKCAVIIVSQE